MKTEISETKKDLVDSLRELADLLEKGITLQDKDLITGVEHLYNKCLAEDKEKAENKKLEKKNKLEKEIQEIKRLNVEPIFEEIANNILEAWITFDKEHNIDKFGHKRYIHESDIIKDNVKKVNALFKRLMERVNNKVGEITSFKNLKIEQGNFAEGIAINGYIEGTKGKVNVKSIVAGGYVQKLHIRVLVK